MLTRWRDYGFGDLDRSMVMLNELRREMDRTFEAYDRDRGIGAAVLPARSGWPRVSLYDKGQALGLRAELPGFSDKDINITIEQGSLTIRGERKEAPVEGYSVHRKERSNIRFARSFTLPSMIDTNKVEATLKNGILELHLPKAAEAKPREIKVKVS